VRRRDGGAIIAATSVMVPFQGLLGLANAVTLAVFAVVDLALPRSSAEGGQAHRAGAGASTDRRVFTQL
jgi:hypothetical protein